MQMTAPEQILAYVRQHWDLVRQVAKQRKRSVYALLHAATPIAVDGIASDGRVELVIEVPHRFHLEKLRASASREIVEWATAQVIERPCRARIIGVEAEARIAPYPFDPMTLRRLMFACWLVEHGLLNEGEGTAQP